MRSILTITFCLFCITNSDAQKSKIPGKQLSKRFEITTFVNFDRYPSFTYAGNPVNYNKLTLSGVSFGIEAGYKFDLSSRITLKPFLGYYKFNISDVDNWWSLFNRTADARGTNRAINFLILSSDKYHYNCINAGVHAEKHFPLKKNREFSAGLQLSNYFTFSQSYHISYDNPSNPIENPYKDDRFGYFGSRVDVSAKLVKKGRKLDIGPSIYLPIISTWKTDDFFLSENDNKTRSKFFGGIGVGVVVGF